MKELQTRLDAMERRLQEANELLQAQIAESLRGEFVREKTDPSLQRKKERFPAALIHLKGI